VIVKRLPASTRLASSEQREQLRSVLGQAAIARFTMTEQVLKDMERMLDFCPNTRLQMFQLFRQTTQFVLGQTLLFLVKAATFVGSIPAYSYSACSNASCSSYS